MLLELFLDEVNRVLMVKVIGRLDGHQNVVALANDINKVAHCTGERINHSISCLCILILVIVERDARECESTCETLTEHETPELLHDRIAFFLITPCEPDDEVFICLIE